MFSVLIYLYPAAVLVLPLGLAAPGPWSDRIGRAARRQPRAFFAAAGPAR